MPHFKQPEQFNFLQPSEWPTWSQRFKRFRLAEKLHKEEGDIQVSALLYAMGDESETIFKTFALTDVEQNYFATVMSSVVTIHRCIDVSRYTCHAICIAIQFATIAIPAIL